MIDEIEKRYYQVIAEGRDPMFVEALKSLIPLWMVFLVACIAGLLMRTTPANPVWVVAAGVLYISVSLGAVMGAIWYRERKRGQV